MCSVEATFQFESYKVDSLRLEMKRILGLLEFQGCIDPKNLHFQIAIRDPIYYKRQKRYLGGISLNLRLSPSEKKEPPSDENALLKIDLSITGLFKSQERLDNATEENLAKLQVPAILLPYARATISSLLANAGFGSVVFPLINIHELAKKAQLKINVVE
jgi:hypothetical protein